MFRLIWEYEKACQIQRNKRNENTCEFWLALKMHQQMSPIITSGADRYRQKGLGWGNGIACSRGFGCQIDRARGKSANRMRRYRRASVLSFCPHVGIQWRTAPLGCAIYGPSCTSATLNGPLAVRSWHWRKKTTLIQGHNSWWYNDFIWCGQKPTTSFKDTSHGGVTISSGVDKNQLPHSRTQVMLV
jgi:hypothetical protein